jgi:mevalonate kinase
MKVRVTDNSDTHQFYGHGKLLLTSEYFVLDGAEALAVPTMFGQRMRVKKLSSKDSTLYWVALNNQRKVWLNLAFNILDFSCINSNSDESLRLSNFLREARKLNPLFLNGVDDYAVETVLEFPNNWGLGSSSTLIHCMGKWAEVDAYTLLQKTIGGSGYDVACAGHESAILYKVEENVPQTILLNWQPSFRENIYFAYLGKKQLSAEAIKYYREKVKDKTRTINELNQITASALRSETLANFEELINEHETIIGSQLKLIKVKDTHFSDYWGSVKSLGAWGGDFVMITNNKTKEELASYLASKKIEPLFEWNEIILAENKPTLHPDNSLKLDL